MEVSVLVENFFRRFILYVIWFLNFEVGKKLI